MPAYDGIQHDLITKLGTSARHKICFGKNRPRIPNPSVEGLARPLFRRNRAALTHHVAASVRVTHLVNNGDLFGLQAAEK